MNAENIVRILTGGSLAGLLGAVGLRLTFAEVVYSLKKCRFGLIVLANFAAVPALTVAAITVFGIRGETAVGMILLAAAPFAPVVPIFARMARADLALAAGLTSIFPVLSAILTPLVCGIALKVLPGTASVHFDVLNGLLILVATITLPLAVGMILRRFARAFSQLLLRPMEILSEAAGATSLAFVTFTQRARILEAGSKALLTMALLMELALALGYWIGGSSVSSRRVVALGTSNRNIAMGILMALQSFPGTTVISNVVANGLLLILLGLFHVAYWRWRES